MQTIFSDVALSNNLKKILAGGALLYATYTVVFCPCTPLIACHKTEFWGSLAVAAITIAIL